MCACTHVIHRNNYSFKVMGQTNDHCGSQVWHLFAAHARKVCEFFPWWSSEGFICDLQFPPSDKKKKEHLGKLCSRVFPKCQTWHFVEGEPGFLGKRHSCPHQIIALSLRPYSKGQRWVFVHSRHGRTVIVPFDHEEWQGIKTKKRLVFILNKRT